MTRLRPWSLPGRVGRRGPIAMALVGALAATSLLTSVAVAADARGIDVAIPVGFTISGVIRTTAGKPVADAFVSATDAHRSSVAMTTTDARGRYTLAGLPQGRPLVAVAPRSGNLRSGYYATGIAGHFTSLTAKAAHVIVGPSRAHVDVILPAGYSISGVIRTAAGKAVSWASVEATGPSGDASGWGAAYTDAAGRYTIRGLSPGGYRVLATPERGSDYRPGWYRTTGASHVSATMASASRVKVGPSRTGISMKLRLGYSIAGRLLTPSGVSLAYSSVTAISGSVSTTAYADFLGRFEVTGLPPGTYRLALQAPYESTLVSGYYSATEPTHVTQSEAAATPIRVGPSRVGITARLAEGLTVAGHIVGASGRPIVNAAIYAVGATDAMATTDSEGDFSLGPLPSGTLTMWIAAPEGAPVQSGWYVAGTPGTVSPTEADATPVTVAADITGLEVQLPGGFSISGTVTSPGCALDDWAFAEAQSVDDSGLWIDGAIRADGAYSIVGLSPGTYRVDLEPGSDSHCVAGFYSATAAGHFTTVEADATPVTVGP